jgi:hypothetical protein
MRAAQKRKDKESIFISDMIAREELKHVPSIHIQMYRAIMTVAIFLLLFQRLPTTYIL